ncbi:unnamed protein product [Amoebophrya sp. A25]|nr:unnamed protein product [Amoebophrya sp. A25]|eukprot:GSA25T00015560001.1
MTDENTSQILHMGLESLTTDGKATEDYTEQVKELLEKKLPPLIQKKRFDDAVEEILTLEKKCRQACDAVSCSKLCKRIILMYKDDAKDWQTMLDYFSILTKKRGQLRRATTDLVLMGMEWINQTPALDKTKRDQLMKVLDQITEAKIFVEVERARLIKIMADDLEAEGKLDEAAALLQEVQVETFGSMEKMEKAKFILNQMRIMLLRRDFIRVQIASRKINEKFLEAEDFQDIKLQYQSNMVQYYLHEEQYLEAAKCFEKSLNTKCVADGEQAKWEPILSNLLIYVLLATRSTEQTEMMAKLMKEVPRKKLEAVEKLQSLVKDFQTDKLLAWPLPCDAELKQHPVFKKPAATATTKSGTVADLMALLRKRVIQHNLRVVSLYYVRVETTRLMALLGLTQNELEEELSELVIAKSIFARIDRPKGVIRFGDEPSAEAKLNTWSSCVDTVLDLVKDTGHLIQKERMIQEAKAKLKKK